MYDGIGVTGDIPTVGGITRSSFIDSRHLVNFLTFYDFRMFVTHVGYINEKLDGLHENQSECVDLCGALFTFLFELFDCLNSDSDSFAICLPFCWLF